MTALVGVLNRHGIAIAADSAVTMGNTHKVINCANKIFTLSKYHPVAVMTYNNASFMGVPWDIIIKSYRKELGERSFPELQGYIDDFIKFLHDRKFFCDNKSQHECLTWLMYSFYDFCCGHVCSNYNIDESKISPEQLYSYINTLIGYNKSLDICPEFQSYSYESFKDYIKDDIEKFKSDRPIINDNLFFEAFFYHLRAKSYIPLFTGLVFVGYGENEIYPSLIPIIVSCCIEDKLRYFEDTNKVAKIVEHGPTSFIVPFAQEDVINTILLGINPYLANIVNDVLGKSIDEFLKGVAQLIDDRGKNNDLSSAIKSINVNDIVRKSALTIRHEMDDIYTNKLFNTVASLDKEDMAHMAESFISLTSLVRRMQPGEETVGGPVDVAVMSKGDGFIWINRKHYFKPEFNNSFFTNYFK